MRLTSENALERFRDYDVVDRRHRQLPDALPLERRLRAARQAHRVRRDPALRGPGLHLRRAARALLPLPVPGAAAARAACPPAPRAACSACCPGIIALIQATEAVKLLTGVGEPLIGRFLHYDALAMRFNEFRFEKDPDCPVCGDAPDAHRADRLRGLLRRACAEENADARGLRRRRSRRCVRGASDFLLLDVREPARVREGAHRGRARCSRSAQLEARLAELADWKRAPRRRALPPRRRAARRACAHPARRRLHGRREPRRRHRRLVAHRRSLRPALLRRSAVAKPRSPIRSSAGTWSSGSSTPARALAIARGLPRRASARSRRSRSSRKAGATRSARALCAPTPSRRAILSCCARCAALLGREPDAASWRAARGGRSAAGKDRYAAEARRQEAADAIEGGRWRCAVSSCAGS